MKKLLKILMNYIIKKYNEVITIVEYRVIRLKINFITLYILKVYKKK